MSFKLLLSFFLAALSLKHTFCVYYKTTAENKI